ncbi:MAG: hypothetical protein AB7U73_05415 [Pirellulales bacterium]
MTHLPQQRRFQFSLRTVLLGMAGLAPCLFVLGLALRVPEVAMLIVVMGVFTAACCIAMAIYALLFLALMRAFEALFNLLALLVGQIEPLFDRVERPGKAAPRWQDHETDRR